MSDRPEFDHGKALALIEQLNAAIRVLNQQTNDRANNARAMQQNWKGHHANQFFGTEVPRMTTQAAELVTRMQNILSAVQGADEAASAATTQWQRQQPQPLPTPGIHPSPPSSSTPSSPTPAPPGRAPTPPATPGG